jgi:hypothetical protein
MCRRRKRVQGGIVAGAVSDLDDLGEPGVGGRASGRRWSARVLDLLGGIVGWGDQAVFLRATVEAAQCGDHVFGGAVAAAAAAADDQF